MAVVAWGIRLVLIGIVLVLLASISVVGMAFTDLPPAMLLIAGIAILVGALCGFVGPFLCLAAPAETGAKPYLWVSIACQLANLAISALDWFPIEVPRLLSIAGMIVSLVGVVFFILFLKALAISLRRPDLDGEADAVISAVVFMAIAYALMFVPLIGCIAVLVATGLAIYFLFKYVSLLNEMASAAAAA